MIYCLFIQYFLQGSMIIASTPKLPDKPNQPNQLNQLTNLET